MKFINYDNVVFYDLETSGLDERYNEIIQIAAYAPLTGKELDIKVKFDISKADPKALEINHYNENAGDWLNAYDSTEARVEFTRFIKEHATLKRIAKVSGRPWYTAAVAGHNINKFDDKWMEVWYEDKFRPFEYRTYDTLTLALWVLPNRESYQLGDLAEYFGISTENAHDALADVKMNAKVCAKLLKYAGVLLPDWAVNELESIIQI